MKNAIITFLRVILFLLIMIVHSQDNSPYSFVKEYSSKENSLTDYNDDILLSIQNQNNNLEESLKDKKKSNLFIHIEENDIIEYLLLTGFDVYTFLINETTK